MRGSRSRIVFSVLGVAATLVGAAEIFVALQGKNGTLALSVQAANNAVLAILCFANARWPA